MLGAILDGAPLIAAQNLRELAREQARRNPGVPLEQTAAPGDYWPKTIEELTKEADVVLQAKVSRMKSYLTPSEERILTDYSIVMGQVIAGRLPVVRTPGAVVPLILTVYGGEVIIEGVLVRATDNSREALKDGGQYLLFLKKSRHPEAGRYEIYYGGVFEVLQERVRPLLKQSESVFKDVANAKVKDLIPRIEKAAQVR